MYILSVWYDDQYGSVYPRLLDLANFVACVIIMLDKTMFSVTLFTYLYDWVKRCKLYFVSVEVSQNTSNDNDIIEVSCPYLSSSSSRSTSKHQSKIELRFISTWHQSFVTLTLINEVQVNVGQMYPASSSRVSAQKWLCLDPIVDKKKVYFDNFLRILRPPNRKWKKTDEQCVCNSTATHHASTYRHISVMIWPWQWSAPPTGCDSSGLKCSQFQPLPVSCCWQFSQNQIVIHVFDLVCMQIHASLSMIRGVSWIFFPTIAQLKWGMNKQVVLRVPPHLVLWQEVDSKHQSLVQPERDG